MEKFKNSNILMGICLTLCLAIFYILYLNTIKYSSVSNNGLFIAYKIVLSIIVIMLLAFEGYENKKIANILIKVFLATLFSVPFLFVLFQSNYSFVAFLIPGYILFTFSGYLYIKTSHSIGNTESFITFCLLSVVFISITFLYLSYFQDKDLIVNKTITKSLFQTLWLRLIYIILLLGFLTAWHEQPIKKFKRIGSHNYKKSVINTFMIGFVYNIVIVKVLYNLVIWTLYILIEYIGRTILRIFNILKKIAKIGLFVIGISSIFICGLFLIVLVKNLSMDIPSGILNPYNWFLTGKIYITILCGIFLISVIKIFTIYGNYVISDKALIYEKSFNSTILSILFLGFISFFVGIIFFIQDVSKVLSFHFTIVFTLLLIIGGVYAIVNKDNENEVNEINKSNYTTIKLKWSILFKDLMPYASLFTFLLIIFIKNPIVYTNPTFKSYLGWLFNSSTKKNVVKPNFSPNHISIQVFKKPVLFLPKDSTINAKQNGSDTIQNKDHEIINTKVFSKKKFPHKQEIIRSDSRNKKNEKSQFSNSTNFEDPRIPRRKPVYLYDNHVDDANVLFVSDIVDGLPPTYNYYHYSDLNYSPYGAVKLFTNCVDCNFKVKIGNNFHDIRYILKKHPDVDLLPAITVEPSDNWTFLFYNKNYSKYVTTDIISIKEGECIVLGVYVDK